MWSALGDTLPLAAGIALSPLGLIICLVLLAAESRGRRKAAIFGLGWAVSIFIIVGIAYYLIGAARISGVQRALYELEVLQLVFTVACLALAVITWVRSLGASDAPRENKLLQRLDGIGVPAAGGLGLAQGFARIKNLLLALGAGARFGEAGLRGGRAVLPVAIFALASTLGVLVPVTVAVLGGTRAPIVLSRARAWLEANISSITIVALLVIGVYFLGQGLDILD